MRKYIHYPFQNIFVNFINIENKAMAMDLAIRESEDQLLEQYEMQVRFILLLLKTFHLFYYPNELH
jgi:hypothetical protein